MQLVNTFCSSYRLLNFVHLLYVCNMKSRTQGINFNSQSVASFKTQKKWTEDGEHSNTSVIIYSEKYYLLSGNKGLGSMISYQGSSIALYTAQTSPSEII